MNTLAEYMVGTKTTEAELAAIVGCDRSMINKLKNRKAMPSLKLALSINRQTGVSVENLMPETDAPSTETAA